MPVPDAMKWADSRTEPSASEAEFRLPNRRTLLEAAAGTVMLGSTKRSVNWPLAISPVASAISPCRRIPVDGSTMKFSESRPKAPARV